MPPNINNNLSHICNHCYKPVRLCNCLTDQQLRRTQQLLELNRLREETIRLREENERLAIESRQIDEQHRQNMLEFKERIRQSLDEFESTRRQQEDRIKKDIEKSKSECQVLKKNLESLVEMKNELLKTFEQFLNILLPNQQELIEMKQTELKQLMQRVDEQIVNHDNAILRLEKQQIDFKIMNDKHEERYQVIVERLKQQYESLTLL